MNRRFQARGVRVLARSGPLPLLVAGLAVILLAGCGGTPKQTSTPAKPGATGIPDAVPRVEPKARYGNMDSYVVFGRRYHTKDSSRGHVERGLASWYGKKFHGRKTSSGERYDMHQMTAAHKTLPLPSYVLVTNLENGRQAIVKVNDRGPFHGTRVIDLSFAAAKKLDVVRRGTAKVEVRSIDPRDHGGEMPKHGRIAAARSAARPAAEPSRGKQVKVHRRTKPKASSPWLDLETAPATAARSKPTHRASTKPSPWIDVGQSPTTAARASRPAATPQRSAHRRSTPRTTDRVPPQVPESALTLTSPAPGKPQPASGATRAKPKAAAEPGPVAVEPTLADAARAPQPSSPEPTPAAAPPAPTPAPAPAAEPSPPAVAAAGIDSGVYLQVGAFGSKQNADQLRSRLLAQVSAPVRVHDAGAAGGRLYKVQVGPLPSRDQAGDMTRQLTALGLAEPMLVVQ